MECEDSVGFYFNPRSPCGERPDVNHDFIKSFTISIHAPRVGSDGIMPILLKFMAYFNPRSPCGERPSCYQLGLSS